MIKLRLNISSSDTTVIEIKNTGIIFLILSLKLVDFIKHNFNFAIAPHTKIQF